jgi:hypothetical protein
VRKEVAAVSRNAKRCADDVAAWEQELTAFYGTHGAYVAETLRVALEDAERYATEQFRALINGGAGIMVDWETRRPGDLIALALGGQHEV